MPPHADFRLPARSATLSWLWLLGTALGGCSLLGLDKDDASNDLNKDAAQYQERPVEQIYADAWAQINKGDWEEAAKQFNEVDRQHPYSVWARRAMLMSAFCSYQANKYADAIATADQYISLHPGSQEVAYAFYLKAISLYEQIVDVSRDQSNTARRAGGAAGRGAAFPRHRICPRRHPEDRPHPGPSGRQGNGGRPLLPDPRRLYRRHQPLPGGGADHTRPRRRSPKRWSA